MSLPPCGIYRTTIGLPGREQDVPAGRLVYFHNHSEQGAPIVLMPRSNTSNRWTFNERGFLIEGEASALFIATLMSLPEEGLYIVQRPIGSGEAMLRPRTLVQVGYNPSGHVILFAAEPRDNGLTFPERGKRFEGLKVFDNLARAPFDAPNVSSGKVEHPDPPTLH